MYKRILIPTGASELAAKAVERGITLAKEIGAKITVPTISVPFHIMTTNAQMIEDTAPQYKRRMAEQAAKILKSVADAASAAKRRDRPAGSPLYIEASNVRAPTDR
jgi:nucleotide-binding universal stress UspA family protein